jgi:hypothetical protein
MLVVSRCVFVSGLVSLCACILCIVIATDKINIGGLKSEPATGQAILTEDNTAIGSIHREDVADLVVRALVSPKTERKILTAIDPSLIVAAAPGSSSAAQGGAKTVPAYAL